MLRITEYSKMEVGYKPQPQNFSYIWFSVHMLAINARTQASKEAFGKYMELLSLNLPCAKCRKHLKQHIEKDHPASHYDEPDGCFRWSWILHNKVNKFLKKTEVKYEDAYDFYKNLENFGCDLEDCNETPKPKEKRTSARQRLIY